MFAWTISLVQILAILACPLTCVSGHACCGSEHFATANFEAAHLQAQASECNCCRDNASRQEEECPPSAPDGQADCQGVCGGAILEKSCELPVETTFSTLPPVMVEVSILIISEVQPLDDSICLFGSGNYGRSLRTLYASFLC